MDARDGIKGKRWRDMMVRVQGPSAAALQAVFAQNWLRVSGEILTGEDYFANNDDGDGAPAWSSEARQQPAPHRRASCSNF